MDKLSNMGKISIVAVVATILIIVIIIYGMGGAGGNNAVTSSASENTTLSAASPAQTPSATIPSASTHGGTAKAPAGPVIYFITPANNDIWKIGTQNLISWNTAGNFTGSISLIDATTKKFIGVILPQVGTKQVSYAWNTRDLLLERTNPLKKDVVPGTYEAEIIYDGNNIRPATSPAFTITN